MWFYQVNDFAFTPGGILAGTSSSTGVYRSADGGATWEYVGLGWQGSNGYGVNSLTVAPNGVVHAGTQDGVFRYSGEGTSWTRQATGMRATWVRSLLFARNGDLFAGTYCGGIGRSSDRGQTWTQVANNFVNDMTPIDSLAEIPTGELVASTGGIGRSIDGGLTWTDVTPGSGNNPGEWWFPHLSVAAGNSGRLYASSWGGVLRSYDHGATWQQVGLADRKIVLVAISPDGTVFAVPYPYPHLWRLANDGQTWEPVGSEAFPDGTLFGSIAFNSQGHVFVSSSPSGFHRSLDNGTTWSQDLDPGSGAGPMVVNEDGVIFKGQFLRRSLDNGLTWEDWRTGMEGLQHKPRFYSLALDSDGFLYAGMWSGGVWRSTVSTRIVKNVRIDIKPGSYPNSINLGSNGKTPVAILSSADFDATTVDPASVTLAGARIALKGKGTYMYSFQDVNGDDRPDMVVHVLTSALELSSTDTMAELEGQTYTGQRIRGVDTVRIVPH
jgi:hypothetical protein